MRENCALLVSLILQERPPDPILYIPGEITLGETITITCMANYTCASSPPTFNWNLIGPYATENSDLGDGKWKATSKLTYTPSEAEKDLIIACTVTYFGGKIVIALDKITIQAGQNVADQKAGETANQYIGPVIGVICVILLLAIVFVLWRKRKSLLPRKKTENSGKVNPLQSTLSKNKYTDLLDRQMQSYYTIEPTALSHMPRPGRPMLQTSQNEPIYEDMTLKQVKELGR
ncbi:uncharacterized protein LOC120992226 isoform X2 [Bufo bufo]|uniref:uncharacterized protein LOC120992226 isoform X2 n=1 Tax=Bufo bufo TaxID=8384 RepID=UPI001ABDD297|nr:uncharacterized protein LOC120992226 isoform X2 [Bufo bufo]